LRAVILKDVPDSVTPHLCLELRDGNGWIYYSHLFSEDRQFLRGIRRVLRGLAGKSIREIGNVECHPGAARCTRTPACP
jgi:hypothetical protein